MNNLADSDWQDLDKENKIQLYYLSAFQKDIVHRVGRWDTDLERYLQMTGGSDVQG